MVHRARWIIPVLVLVACGVEGTSLLISDAQEAELGAEVHQQVLAEYPLYNDATVQAWVDDLGARLAAASEVERGGVTYRFHVVDSDIVNAFAAPGGYLYLTRGLIIQADNEAEVAGVLGHEVGHVSHRHGVAQIERAAIAGMLGDIILGDGTLGDDVVSFVSNFVLSTGYSQDQESDADTLGIEFAYRAGINPYGLVDFFGKLNELSGGSAMPDWLSSHPAPLDRANATTTQIQQIGGVSRDSSGLDWDVTGQFENIQSILAY